MLWTSVVLAISFPDCFECTVAMGQPIAGLQLATSLYRNNYKIMFFLIIDKLLLLCSPTNMTNKIEFLSYYIICLTISNDH